VNPTTTHSRVPCAALLAPRAAQPPEWHCPCRVRKCRTAQAPSARNTTFLEEGGTNLSHMGEFLSASIAGFFAFHLEGSSAVSIKPRRELAQS